MKRQTLIIITFIINITLVNAQNISQSDINTTCFVISELMAKAKDKGDLESILIYSNAIDKIKRQYNVHPTYLNYFDSIKVSNPNLSKGILISLNNPPKSPGFTNKEIDDLMLLKKEGITLFDIHNLITLKRISQNKIKLESLNKLELKKLKSFKKEIEQLKIKIN